MYEGRHRAATEPTGRSAWRLAAGAVGAVLALLVASPAAANPVVPVPAGATYSGLVARYCPAGTSWQALSFPGRDKNLIYAGERIDLRCTQTGQASSSQAPQTTAVQATGWSNPLPGACVSSNFGWRWGRMHYGTDISARAGTPIRAARAGTVSTAWQSGAGNYTVINHGGGLYTVYMHQSSYAVRSGWVNAGQVIGYVGATGNATGPHLHLEVHPGGLWNRGAQVNPVWFLAQRGVRLGC